MLASSPHRPDLVLALSDGVVVIDVLRGARHSRQMASHVQPPPAQLLAQVVRDYGK